MSRPRRMLLTVARALATTLIVSLAGSGVSVSAAHVTACDMSASHCQRATIVASCCCHDSGLPAASATSAAVGVAKMPVAAAAPAPASSVCAFPVAARPDYSLARGRQFIPLRLLYSSLLI